MSIYAQHGHAKSNRITSALDANYLKGVIFGAKNESPDKLEECIAEMRASYPDTELILDPQFYVSALDRPKDRFLTQYPYYQAKRTARDFIKAQNISNYVKDTIDFQISLGLDAVVSPTVLFDSFDDRWYQIALNLTDESVAYHQKLTSPPRLIINFAFSEDVLNSQAEVDDFLNQITSWESLDAVYLLVSRNEKTYSQQFEDVRLANLMYLIYILGKRNNFEVVCGYSDFVGILLKAAGATSFATGWFQGLRQFHKANFMVDDSRGGPARPRYSSLKLFNSILLSELEQIHNIGALDEVLSGIDQDKIITAASSPETSSWSLSDSEQSHWATLANLDSELTGDVEIDMASVLAKLKTAKALYASLQQSGVIFESHNTREHHLDNFIDATESFQEKYAAL